MPDMKPTTHTLLIWEEVPETTKLALIDNDTLDADDRATLKLAHNNYINDGCEGEVLAALNRINSALCDSSAHLDDEHPMGSKWAMRWSSLTLEEDEPIEGTANITHVYRCGFLL